MNPEQIRYLKAMGIEPWQLKNNKNIEKSNVRLIIVDTGPLLDRDDQLLTAMLESIGLDRENICITTTDDLANQCKRIKPTALLALGQAPAHYLLETKTPLEELRGKIHTYGLTNTPLIITYHPAYLLRSPREKSKAFQDLQLVQMSL